MNGQQALVAAGGVGLIAVNFWTGDQRRTVLDGIYGDGDPQASHRELVKIAGEALFVVVAAVLAGVSNNWGTTMVVLIVALFILWAMNHYGAGDGTGKIIGKKTAKGAA